MPVSFRERGMQHPVFPYMLERMIFEMAVEDIVLPPSKFAVNLQLTAKRVRLWIRPILYKVFEYSYSPFPFPDFDAHPRVRLEDVGPHAKNLVYCILPHQDIDFLRDLLKKCPNISNLAIWFDVGILAQIYPTFKSLPRLRRLSAGFRGLAQDQILSPIFLNLTHLDILGNTNWDVISELKNLTHLSIAERPPHVDRVLDAICAPDGCSSLKVVTMFEDPVTVYDIRIVVIRGYYDHLTDWMKAVNGKLDSWTFAERIVIARERGYMRFSPNSTVNFWSFSYRTEFNREGQIWWREML